MLLRVEIVVSVVDGKSLFAFLPFFFLDQDVEKE
jgi:hypothetical protein